MLTAFRCTRRIAPPRIFGLLALILCMPGASVALAEDVKVAFIGDQGVSPIAQQVLELIRDEGTDLLLIQGDLGYDPNSADLWIENIDSILGKDFPVLMVVGNHENYEWPKYLQWQKEKLARVSDIQCEGDTSVKAYCTYKGIGVVQVSPGINEVDGINGDDNYADYISEKFSTDTSDWRICSWHKNMRDMQAGGKGDATGWGVYQNCLAQGGIVLTGHEHSYSRTHLMSDFQNLQVIHTDDEMDIGPGSSIAFVSGLGGREVRPQEHGGDWFASIYSSSQNANAGSLFCNFNGDKADCYFKDVVGLVPDSFSLTSKLDSSDEARSEEQARVVQSETDAAEEEAESQAQAEADAAEQEAREEAESQAQAEADAAEQEAREEAERQAQAEADAAEQEAREEAERQAQAEADAAEQEAREEAERQAQAEADAAEQEAREEAERQAQAEADAAEQEASEAQRAEQQTTANQDEQPITSSGTASTETAEQDVDASDTAENESADTETTSDNVPTRVADSESTPIIGAASPPPPLTEAAEATTSGGGSLGWLSILTLCIAGMMRRLAYRARRHNG